MEPELKNYMLHKDQDELTIRRVQGRAMLPACLRLAICTGRRSSSTATGTMVSTVSWKQGVKSGSSVSQVSPRSQNGPAQKPPLASMSPTSIPITRRLRWWRRTGGP